MKNRLEEYVRAIIDAEEAKMTKAVFLIAMVVIIASVFFTMLIVVSSQPVIVGFVIVLAVAIFARIVHNKYSKKQEIAERKRDLLHPVDGEEGALVTAKKKIEEMLTGAFGKKFTGVRNTDDLDGRNSS